MRAEGFARGSVRIDRTLDVRYAGQSYELTVRSQAIMWLRFIGARTALWLFRPNRSCEVVNVRARFTGKVPSLAFPDCAPAVQTRRSCGCTAGKSTAIFSGRKYPTTIYDRAKLQDGIESLVQRS